LELALNLLDLYQVVCTECDFTTEDYEQHVNECSVRMFISSSSMAYIASDSESTLCMGNSLAGREHLQAEQKSLPLPTSEPKARQSVTKSGQLTPRQSNACLHCLMSVGKERKHDRHNHQHPFLF